eukprot:scaffold224561_cov15-Tisochrysis_lutea.AAC.1
MAELLLPKRYGGDSDIQRTQDCRGTPAEGKRVHCTTPITLAGCKGITNKTGQLQAGSKYFVSYIDA